METVRLNNKEFEAKTIDKILEEVKKKGATNSLIESYAKELDVPVSELNAVFQKRILTKIRNS